MVVPGVKCLSSTFYAQSASQKAFNDNGWSRDAGWKSNPWEKKDTVICISPPPSEN